MVEKDVFDEIDGTDIPKILSDLVSLASDDSEELVIEYIIRRLKEIGVEYEITEVAPARRNLIATTGSGEKSLIFNTHMDTIPPGNMENWLTPPLKLTRKGDELFGLGSCDAKGSLVSMLVAFELLARNPSLLNGKLIFQAVCCEETRARGTLAETRRGISADAAIIGEPTELVPMIGHKGALGLEITVSGISAHGSSPDQGVNAISKMANVICALDDLAQKLSACKESLFGNSSLAVTQIHGGQAPNVIPDSCTITVDRRLIPGETVKGAWNEIVEVINRERNIDESLEVSVEEMIGIEPCTISLDEPIVKVAKESIVRVTGKKTEPAIFTACCDMWCLVEKANIPTIILGPGRLSVAHRANESVSVDELYKSVKIYAFIALNWLNSKRNGGKICQH